MLVAVVAGMLIGFLAGLWSFRVKNRWCPRCGAMTSEFPPGPEAG